MRADGERGVRAGEGTCWKKDGSGGRTRTSDTRIMIRPVVGSQARDRVRPCLSAASQVCRCPGALLEIPLAVGRRRGHADFLPVAASRPITASYLAEAAAGSLPGNQTHHERGNSTYETWLIEAPTTRDPPARGRRTPMRAQAPRTCGSSWAPSPRRDWVPVVAMTMDASRRVGAVIGRLAPCPPAPHAEGAGPRTGPFY
jgi:hypothetical protein